MAAKKTETKTFGEKLHACYAELAFLTKDGFNDHFKYKFVSEASVKKAVNEALRKHGLWMSRCVTQVDRVTDDGVTVAECLVVITDGEREAFGGGCGGGKDSGDKGPMKANAAALKYALTSLFLIATGDDPEADSKTDAPTPRKAGRGKPLVKTLTVAALIAQAEGLSSKNELAALKTEAAQFANDGEFPKLKAAVKAAAERVA